MLKGGFRERVLLGLDDVSDLLSDFRILLRQLSV